MNIFNKAALESLKKSRTRTFVTIIGVVLSAALVTAGAAFGVSLLSYVIHGAQTKEGSWHVGFKDVSDSFVKERIEDKEAESVAVTENIGYAKLPGGQNPDSPYVYITGYDEEDFAVLPVNLISGRIPQNSSEILVSGGVLTTGGVNLSEGDTLKLSVGERIKGEKKLGQSDAYSPDKEKLVLREEKTYTVVGICQRPSYADSTDPGYTLITRSKKERDADSFNLFVSLKNPRKARDYADSKGGGSPAVLNDNVLRFMGASDNDIFNILLYTVGGIAVAIIMAGSVFLIRNTFNISLNERTRQFGILMSVGATKKQLQNSVLFEGMCIGAAGIPAGVLLGIAGTKLVIYIVGKNFEGIMYDNVPLKLVLSVPAIIAAVAISLATILISAYIPARKAFRTPVMECIRQTNEVRIEGKDVKAGSFAGRIYGLPGMLAIKNFKRNKRRYRSIIFSLVLSVVLFIATGSFVLELQQASEAAVIFTTYDIAFSSQDMPDDGLFALWEELKTAGGITDSSYQAVLNCHTTVETDKLTDELKKAMNIPSEKKEVKLPVRLQIVDDAAYLETAKEAGLTEEECMGENAKLLTTAKVYDELNNRVMMPDEFADMFTEPSADITIVLPEEESADGKAEEELRDVSLCFVEVVMPDVVPSLESGEQSEEVPYVFTVMAPYSMKEQLITPDTHISAKGLTFNTDRPSRTESNMRKMISDIDSRYLFFNSSKTMEQNNNMIFIANVFCYTFIAMISLIAVANVFNTISTNIKLRRRELAMLRSVGMSERSFQRMMNFECVLYGLRALMWGLPLSILVSWLIYQVMQFGADNIDFVLPLASIGISILGVFFIVFVTMLYSVSKIKKENIIDALRDDMT